MVDFEVEALKTCSNCKYAIDLGYKKYYCPNFNHEVYWCSTCSKHDEMKTYTTDEMIMVLSKINFDVTFLLEENKNIHVFNDIYRNICIGEYGNGDIVKFNKNDYINKKWVIE